MRIAVATENGRTISAHFGRSPLFAIYDIANGTFTQKELRKNTFTQHFKEGHQHGEGHGQGAHHHGEGHGDGHRGVAAGLSDCQVVISHGMGRRAVDDLTAAGKEIFVTSETDVQTAVRAWIDKTLTTDERRIHG